MEYNNTWATVHDIIHYYAKCQPGKAAIIFEDGSEKIELTYKELYSSSMSIANSLIGRGLQGETVILKFGQGLEFIQTFLGCLIAGVIPVPVNRPAPKEQKWQKLMPIITDSKATVVIGESGYISRYHEWLSKQAGFEAFSCFEFDDLEGSCECEHSLPHIDADSLAFLQYTSGSTSDPKGVMVSHRNILMNSALIAKSFDSDSNTVSVSWLPLFHDAGMIGIFMHLLYVGGTTVLIPPAAFVQNPILWLKLITKYSATYTGGPNFGYDLCQRRVSNEQAEQAGIDLSSLRGVFNGAEPVRWETLKNFQSKFEPFGFDFDAFVPCYGMAESTLMITGIKVNEAPINLKLDKDKLEQGEVKQAISGSKVKILPSCGINQDGTDIIVVDPLDNRILDDMQEGEIWLRGPSVAMGFFNNPIATEERFAGRTKCGEGPYLKTGDLGFLHQTHLYVTGRASDLIILNGKNYYPQDIEDAISKSVDCILGDSIAVASQEIDGEEKVFIIAEITRVALRKLNQALVCQQIKEVVAAEYQLEIEYIGLIKPSSIPKTTSGKVKRRACLNAIFDNSLQLVKSGKSYECNKPELEPQMQGVLDNNCWTQFKRVLVGELSIDEKEIQPSSTLISLGVNSLKMGALAYALGQYSHVPVNIEELLELNSIDEFFKSHSWDWDKETDCFKDYKQPISNDSFPLTDIQTGYVVGRLNQFKMGGVGLQSYFEFDGEFCIQRVQDSWNTLISKTPMLRAMLDRSNRQKILSSVPEYHLTIEDITSLSVPQKKLRLEEKRASLASLKLNLEVWPPFELNVTKLEPGRRRLHITLDGTFLDATSVVKIFASLANIYKEKALSTNSENFGFEHFCRTMKRDEVKYSNSLAFWGSKIEDFPLSPQISSLRVKAPHEQPRFCRLYKDFKESDLDVLSQLGKRWGVTRHIILLTAFAQTIAQWSLNQRFSISIPMQNRANLDPSMAKAVGHFSSFTLQRFDLREKTNFKQVCLATMQETKALLKNNAISGIELLDLIRKYRENVFYPVVFTNLLELDSSSSGVEQLEDALGELNYSITRTPQVQLDCQVMKTSRGIRICWDYDQSSFDTNLLDEMFNEYISGLVHLTTGATELPVSTETQGGLQTTYQAIERANDTYVDRRERTLIEGFLSCAQLMPDNVAVIDGERHITYGELLKYASGIAQILRNGGCQKDDKVIIAQQKGWQQVVLVIAVLQTGASFVPVDPAMPISRLISIVERCCSDWLVTDAATEISSAVCERIQHMVRFDECNLKDADHVINLAQPSDLAYVIFTSGSTGEPKGVAIEHRSAMNTIESVNNIWEVKYDDIALGLSEFSFDLSVYDIFGLLSVGGTIVLAHSSQSPQQWAELIQKHEITIWSTVPAMMELLCDYLSEARIKLHSIRATQLSGDLFPVSLPPSIRAQLPATKIINMGGATEASIWSIYYPVTGREQEQFGYIPYGKPLDNQLFYLLNEELEPVNPGAIGELFIAGKGLARGYLNDEKKTNDAFFWCEKLGQRVYRTGDLGQYQDDGNLRFCGRKDSQVKINGYRIELGELETTCNELETIKRAYAIPYGDARNRQLALFVTAQNISEQHLLTAKPTELKSSLYFQRQSLRQFDNINNLEEAVLGKLLASISALTSTGGSQIKYRYPSAGTLYAVHTYIHLVKKVGPLEPGFYVFDSIAHQLEFLSESENIYKGIGFGNIPQISASASFMIYLVADNSEIARKYGVKARDFALLEAGYMSQLLMTTAPELGLGICPLGYSEFPGLSSKLLLDVGQDVIHVLAGGPVADDAYQHRELIPRTLNSEEGILNSPNARKIQKQVKAHLANKLPIYMQPQEICVIENLPLTVNNKVNVKALGQLLDELKKTSPSLASAEFSEEIDNDILNYLRSLWETLINDQEMALDDSFIEKGVNSITAIKMLTRINKKYHIDLALAEIFENASFRKLALAIEQRRYPKVKHDVEVVEGTL